MSDDDPGFFRNLSGLATAWVSQKRKALQAEEPTTNVDEYGKSGGKGSYSFDGQELSHEDLRDIKRMRESGGTVSALMDSKALLYFGEGVDVHVEDNEETEQPVEGYDEPITLREYLLDNFDDLDRQVLELGKDAMYYPYAVGEIRENRAGGFADFLPAQPWTLLPETNRKGEIIAWHEKTQNSGHQQERTLSSDELTHLLINKNSARDQTGISEVLRNKDEIQAYKENEKAIQNAIELHGFPQRHVKVGREEGAPVRDDELRRVRQIFSPSNTDANTAYFTGQDVDIESLEAEQFDYGSIHEMSMRQLTTALSLPLEVGNVGSDGLGSGAPAELRMALLKLNIKSTQRMFARQYIDKVMRPVIDEFSPFDPEQNIELNIGDPLEDIGDMADLINTVGEHFTNDEIRQKLDMPKHEDDEIGESYRDPATIEAPEEETQDDGIGGLFSRDMMNHLRGAGKAKQLQGDFEATVFELVATDEQEDFTTGDRLGIGIEFPNSGVYVDWNIDAWPEDERLDGPHVSEYATIEDAQTVAQGEVRELQGNLELQDIEDIDTTPPEGVQDAAQTALDWKDETGNPNDCGTQTGWTRASQLASGENLSEDTINRMVSYFARHDEGGSDQPREDCSRMMWKAWGGDPGKRWAESKQEEFDNARENSSGETDFSNVRKSELEKAEPWEASLLELHQRIWDADKNMKLLDIPTFSETPDFVRERIKDAIRSGAVFSDIAGVGGDDLLQVREFMTETLAESDGWTVDGLADQLEQVPGIQNPETVARTETASVLNTARETGYEEQFDEPQKYYWSGALDSRTTDACRWLINKTNPFEGGEPVEMDELKDLIAEAPTHDPDMDNNLARPENFVIHPQERKTFIRAPPSET